eukprot:TRINITY_DN22581_c6_g1_i1.p1 TRINITY_DN22581_c6_g1~~TRINITY_DN22581_c6_g1_i1.p1  ORF type:complete len:272 (-),score=64.68 TRINITY_DN22581_c6_g1_i1:158-973(-)
MTTIPTKYGEFDDGPGEWYDPIVKTITTDNILAIDCEMVGGKGFKSLLAQVAIVNWNCEVVFLSYVKPEEDILDYRTEFSGIRPENLVGAMSFSKIRERVKNILKNKVIVGHSLDSDLTCLELPFQFENIRDSAHTKLFMKRGKSSQRLKNLARDLLGMTIQTGEHSPVEDAIATMRLYQKYQQKWECSIKERRKRKNLNYIERRMLGKLPKYPLKPEMKKTKCKVKEDPEGFEKLMKEMEITPSSSSAIPMAKGQIAMKECVKELTTVEA